MNKIDYSTQPKEKGIDNYVWVLETKIKLAENDIEALKKDLILDVNENKFEKLQYYSFELNRLKTIKTELRNSLTILRVNLKKNLINKEDTRNEIIVYKRFLQR